MNYGGGTIAGKRYRGMWNEGASGMTWMRNRFYDPSIGRFITSDPAYAGNNWYAYCGGDPVNRWDPSGLNWIWNETNSQWEPDFVFDTRVPKPMFGYDPASNGGKTRFTWGEIRTYIGYLQQVFNNGGEHGSEMGQLGDMLTRTPIRTIGDPGDVTWGALWDAHQYISGQTYSGDNRDVRVGRTGLADYIIGLTQYVESAKGQGGMMIAGIGFVPISGATYTALEANPELVRGIQRGITEELSGYKDLALLAGNPGAVGGMLSGMFTSLAQDPAGALAGLVKGQVGEVRGVLKQGPSYAAGYYGGKAALNASFGAVFKAMPLPEARRLLGEGPETSAVYSKSKRAAGVTRMPRHHAFPQEHRAWFHERGFDIDAHTIELDEGVHSAVHSMNWNAAMMGELQRTEKLVGRHLTPDEILSVGENMLNTFHVPFTSWLPFKD